MTSGSRLLRRACAAILPIAAGFAAGCNNAPGFEPLNMSDGLGPYVPLDSLRAHRAPSPPEGESDSGRTVLDIERTNWVQTTVLVPISGVEHHPHYTGFYPLLATQTARQRGEFPTAESALQTTTDHGTQRQFGEGLAAPVFAAADILLFIPRTFCAPILSVVESPMDRYERTPSLVPIAPAPPPAAPPAPPSPVPMGVPEIPRQPTPDESKTRQP